MACWQGVRRAKASRWGAGGIPRRAGCAVALVVALLGCLLNAEARVPIRRVDGSVEVSGPKLGGVTATTEHEILQTKSAIADPAATFDLPAVPTGQWVRPEDLGDRPLVVVRIASWSASCRRLLPVWKRQLERAVQAGDIHVVLIAEEQHTERAAWLCHESRIEWPLLHEPLPWEPASDYPSVSVIDRWGRVLQPRLTLTQVASGNWAANEDGTNGHDPAGGSAAATPRWADQALGTLLESFLQQRQQSAPLADLQPLADHLLRRCFFSPPADTPQVLGPLTAYFREALFSTQDAVWAFRLGVAHRLWFDQLYRTGTIQAQQLQESVHFLEWANRATPAIGSGATAGVGSGRWEAWLTPLRPLIDRPTVAFPGSMESSAFAFLSERSAQPEGWQPETTWVDSRPAEFATATAAPWTAVRHQLVWVLGAADPTSAGQWARLFLHVQLKRGDWDLAQPTHLEWTGVAHGAATEAAGADQTGPRWQVIEVQPAENPPVTAAPAPAAAGSPPAPAEASRERTKSVWLEADVWLPNATFSAAPDSNSESRLPPARNATLYFFGRDPLTGETTPRRFDFYLPPPTRAKLDW